MSYDAIMLVSFGGPEGMDDVIPYLENVLRGKNVPHERMMEVAEHYRHFGGVSPINAQNKALLEALKPELKQRGIDLPVYWGNRNWEPYIPEVLKQMQDDGVKNYIALVTSSFSSYSGCRQYRENLKDAQEALGEDAPRYAKIRVWYNHPKWIEVNKVRYEEALSGFPADQQNEVFVAFTAHSIPGVMADSSAYEKQLMESCRLVAESAGIEKWKLVYQSRSGPPQQPWLEPDVCDYLEELHSEGVNNVIVQPIGFISDHLEVMFDLDEEAVEKAGELGMNMQRAGTAGIHPLFVEMLAELVQERIEGWSDKQAVGNFPANHDCCPKGCCKMPARPAGAGHGHR